MNAIEVQMNSTLTLLAAMTWNYEGSEFCAGVHFGIHGSNLLINVAKALVDPNVEVDVMGDA